MARTPRNRADVAVFAEIAAIAQLSRARVERALPDGLSQAGLNMLSHLAQHGETSPAALARAFALTKGAVTNTLQRLGARGLIRILGDAADGRRKRIALTAAGIAAYDRAVAAARFDLEA
ncbi:MAG TPA: MarR family transcriptional regulator, partial [Caulobacteraceae bacterium]|nr:MarR family transcriptional regulator [Caulobacteraceae bacterium]